MAERAFRRAVDRVRRRYEELAAQASVVPFAVRGSGGHAVIGSGEPAFTLTLERPEAVSALAALDLLRVGEAYLSGALGVEGNLVDVLSLRGLFRDRDVVGRAWTFLRPRIFGQIRSDEEYIAAHYDEDPEFFLTFLDRDHRCYSQGVFERDDEPLEAGIRRKLDFALDAVGAREGDRVLDVGGGWGAFTEHAGRRGIRVTSLTISRASENFINGLIDTQKLPCEVRREHLFEHQPGERYDAIVNLGVTEHLPDYPLTLKKYAALLRPGGRVCLDASACRIKYSVSRFLQRHIFPGNGSPVCLDDYLAAVARSPFSLMAVHNDTHNYELTTLHWARNLDRHREEIERRWGRTQYRRFQVYLWGCVDSFRRDVAQAYRWVLEMPGAAR